MADILYDEQRFVKEDLLGFCRRLAQEATAANETYVILKSSRGLNDSVSCGVSIRSALKGT
jgi:hypothetical protein